jgi:hypothetical protein
MMRRRKEGYLGGLSAYIRVVISSAGAALLVCLTFLFVMRRRDRKDQYPDLVVDFR